MSSPRTTWILCLVALGLWLAHAWVYTFQCDDAFITYRYAANLAAGEGFVFNPGGRPVEGFTSLSWMLWLSVGEWLGVGSERWSPASSLAATCGLWALVSVEACRTRDGLGFLPVLLLAATRSVAVWSTGGLETRWFELLVVAATVRTLTELRGGRSVLGSTACWAMALATRPEALAIAFTSAGLAGVFDWRAGRRGAAVGRLAAIAAAAAALVGWREWVFGWPWPNTWYAKVDQRAWWDAGGAWIASFALEYGLWAWWPLVGFGAWRAVRAGRAAEPLLWLGALVPSTVAAVGMGGDHFEFRPLDVWFPALFLLAREGVVAIAEQGGRWVAGGSVALTLALLIERPLASHLGFPEAYAPGFPGMVEDWPPARDWLAPSGSPLARWPGLRQLAESHRSLVAGTTRQFVGIRAEEHAAFAASMEEPTAELGRLLARGVLRPDTHLALDCVGILPYRTGLPVLDRHGLTDDVVAHGPALPGTRMMAHDKMASFAHARASGVDLWALEAATPVMALTDRRLGKTLARAVAKPPGYYADLNDGWVLLVRLPQGLDAARERFPELDLRRIDAGTQASLTAPRGP